MWFSKKKEVVVEVVAPVVQAAPAITVGEHRLGMWVVTTEGVGIVVPEGVILVKADGTNKMTLDEQDKAVPHLVQGVLRQAFLEEIPENRRPNVDNVLGYRSAQ